MVSGIYILYYIYNEYPQGRPEASDDRFLSKTFSNFQFSIKKSRNVEKFREMSRNVEKCRVLLNFVEVAVRGGPHLYPNCYV